jgi:DNA-binding winged helix-turn-helix (wHTH) protein
MNFPIFTRQEQKAYDLLLQKSDRLVARDDIARAIWGKLWLKKYSDWRIDRLIYLLRRKIPAKYSIRTVRNRGYVFFKHSLQVDGDLKLENPGTLPTKPYLEYMNDLKNKRRVLEDLFKVLKLNKTPHEILIINSYSFDNVDAAAKSFPKSEVFFTNFDPRALKLHQDRTDKLKLTNFHSMHDDIRKSVLKDGLFDLVINDFRLNFNTSNAQNKLAMTNICRILRPGGKAVISVVVDARFESEKYGRNQENAPINKDKPWKFIAQEGLERKCFTVPYYKRLFEQSGFKTVLEFDIKQGKNWSPPYRRFILTK